MSYSEIERGPMAADVLGMHFVQIANQVFRDPRTSGRAKGIFGNIATHQRGYRLSPERIARDMTDGVNSIKSGLRELERFGYLHRTRERRADGTLGNAQYWITDIPDCGSVVEDAAPGDDAPESRSTPTNSSHSLAVTSQRMASPQHSTYEQQPSTGVTRGDTAFSQRTTYERLTYVGSRAPKEHQGEEDQLEYQSESGGARETAEAGPPAHTGPETETDTGTETDPQPPQTPGGEEPDTEQQPDTAVEAERVVGLVDWPAEVDAYPAQRAQIRAAIAAALDRGVDPAVLAVYVPAKAREAHTVGYVLDGLTPDRLPPGATFTSLGLSPPRQAIPDWCGQCDPQGQHNFAARFVETRNPDGLPVHAHCPRCGPTDGTAAADPVSEILRTDRGAAGSPDNPAPSINEFRAALQRRYGPRPHTADATGGQRPASRAGGRCHGATAPVTTSTEPGRLDGNNRERREDESEAAYQNRMMDELTRLEREGVAA